ACRFLPGAAGPTRCSPRPPVATDHGKDAPGTPSVLRRRSRTRRADPRSRDFAPACCHGPTLPTQMATVTRWEDWRPSGPDVARQISNSAGYAGTDVSDDLLAQVKTWAGDPAQAPAVHDLLHHAVAEMVVAISGDDFPI